MSLGEMPKESITGWNCSDSVTINERRFAPHSKQEAYAGDVKHVAFSPDGARIVTASSDHTARVYRVITATELTEILGR